MLRNPGLRNGCKDYLMYQYQYFAKFLIVLLVIAIILLIIKRIRDKRKEDFEDRDN